MPNQMPWIIIMLGFALILLVLALVMVIKFKKAGHKPDYFMFFVIGLIWTAVGLSTKNLALWAPGLIFFISGLANKSKWEENRRRWSDLDEGERRFKLIVIGILTFLILAGITVLLVTSRAA